MGSMGLLLADWSVELFRARRKKAKKAKLVGLMKEKMENMEEMEDVVEAVDRVAEDGGHSNEEKIVSSGEVKSSTGEAQLDQANFGSGTKRNLLVTLILFWRALVQMCKSSIDQVHKCVCRSEFSEVI